MLLIDHNQGKISKLNGVLDKGVGTDNYPSVTGDYIEELNPALRCAL